MLTGYTAPTRGEVRVLGVDRERDPIAANRNIGYLPENVPLYPDLRVREYLVHRARLRGLRARGRRTRIDAVLGILELEPVARRPIGHLSKGYRQRVGLAAALLNEPPALILDEPTVGLDPRQVRQFRALVGGLRERHAILISSHVLPELEKVCDRVLMLHLGRRIALDAPDRLRARHGGGVTLIARGDTAVMVSRLAAIDGVIGVTPESSEFAGWTTFRIGLAAAENDALDAIGATVAEAGGTIRELSRDTTDLEHVFMRLLAREGGAR
jgi:ABC-2 type transport system ATP-binding protein